MEESSEYKEALERHGYKFSSDSSSNSGKSDFDSDYYDAKPSEQPINHSKVIVIKAQDNDCSRPSFNQNMDNRSKMQTNINDFEKYRTFSVPSLQWNNSQSTFFDDSEKPSDARPYRVDNLKTPRTIQHVNINKNDFSQVNENIQPTIQDQVYWIDDHTKPYTANNSSSTRYLPTSSLSTAPVHKEKKVPSKSTRKEKKAILIDSEVLNTPSTSTYHSRQPTLQERHSRGNSAKVSQKNTEVTTSTYHSRQPILQEKHSHGDSAKVSQKNTPSSSNISRQPTFQDKFSNEVCHETNSNVSQPTDNIAPDHLTARRQSSSPSDDNFRDGNVEEESCCATWFIKCIICPCLIPLLGYD